MNQVVFAISDATGYYWYYTAVAMASMLSQASEKPNILLLHDGKLSEVAVRRLNLIAQDEGAPLRMLKVDLERPIGDDKLGPYTVASLYRLLIPSLLSAEDTALYLDSDLVFHGIDVHEMFALIRANEAALIAVRDQFIGLSDKHLEPLKALGLDPLRYFNSGVLGFHGRALEPSDRALFNDFLSWSRQAMFSHHPDQDFLNDRFKNRWLELDENYNFHVSIYDRRMFLQPHAYHGKILHYAGKAKPLDGSLAPGCIPFWSYASKVPELMTSQKRFDFHYLMPIINRQHAASALVVKPR